MDVDEAIERLKVARAAGYDVGDDEATDVVLAEVRKLRLQRSAVLALIESGRVALGAVDEAKLRRAIGAES